MAPATITRKPVPQSAVPQPSEESLPKDADIVKPGLTPSTLELAVPAAEEKTTPIDLYKHQIWNKPKTWTKRTKWIVAGVTTVVVLVIIIGGAVGGTRGGGGVDCSAEPNGYGCHCYEEPSEC